MNSKGGTITYFTGGTTKVPRMVNYSVDRWNDSVKVTQEVLSAHGVDQSSKVLICHPFAPWAIGQVFSDAAIKCGASVFPVGLYFMDENFHDVINEIDFTHVCSTARNMIRWKKRRKKGKKNFQNAFQKIFVAGEKLTAELRMECTTLWKSSIVDIYGMAEFDTIAAELPGSKGLVLSPHLFYGLKFEDAIIPLSKNSKGQLLIKQSTTADWFETGDLVQVESKWSKYPWFDSFQISFMDRIEESIILSDGSVISFWQIRDLLNKFNGIRLIQIQMTRTAIGDRIKILYSMTNNLYTYNDDDIIKHLVYSSIDVQDSFMHQIICEIECMKITDDKLFHQTSRGKIPLFVTIPNEKLFF